MGMMHVIDKDLKAIREKWIYGYEFESADVEFPECFSKCGMSDSTTSSKPFH